MEGILQELVRLECAKQKALIEGNAPVYEDSVRAQLHALDSTSSLETVARRYPDCLHSLAKLMRQNMVLFWNLMSVSPAFELSRVGYTSEGAIETQVGGRVQVEA
jgi:hypothetical protein